MYISASLNVCMCTMYVLGIYRGQKKESGRSLGSGVPGGLSHLSSSQGSFFQEADFPFLKSELALRAALTDRLWEWWQYTSTREPVKLEFYLGNPRPPSCGTAPNKGLQRGRSSAILCSQNEPSPFTNLPSECSHGSRQNQQKNLSRGPTKEWKVL